MNSGKKGEIFCGGAMSAMENAASHWVFRGVAW
jgi:hypothetical protein